MAATRRQYMQALAPLVTDELVVAGIGSVASDWALAAPRDGNFCLSGPMGQAIPIALGLALARPERTVIAMEGDGGLLMNLVALSTVASQSPRNLKILVFNNGLYESSGCQPVPSAGTDYSAVASALRIPFSRRVADVPSLVAAFNEARETPAPCFIELIVAYAPDEAPPYGLITAMEAKASLLRGLKKA